MVLSRFSIFSEFFIPSNGLQSWQFVLRSGFRVYSKGWNFLFQESFLKYSHGSFQFFFFFFFHPFNSTSKFKACSEIRAQGKLFKKYYSSPKVILTLVLAFTSSKPQRKPKFVIRMLRAPFSEHSHLAPSHTISDLPYLIISR